VSSQSGAPGVAGYTLHIRRLPVGPSSKLKLDEQNSSVFFVFTGREEQHTNIKVLRRPWWPV
jgi:hypothetical protein